jgi:anti-sigma factor (TIGR02949 family)
MITCREVADFLMSYLDEELPAAQRAEFERHLVACPPCRRYMDSYEQAVRLGKEAMKPGECGLEPAPEGLIQAILAARRAARDKP